MSHLGYFADMFHNFGSLSIELDNALNTIVRSFRSKVLENKKEEAKEKLSAFLSFLLEEDENKPVELSFLRIKQFLSEFIKEQEISQQVEMIRQKIMQEKKLSGSEVNMLDDLISQISRQATVAFRKIRRAV